MIRLWQFGWSICLFWRGCLHALDFSSCDWRTLCGSWSCDKQLKHRPAGDLEEIGNVEELWKFQGPNEGLNWKGNDAGQSRQEIRFERQTQLGKSS